MAQPKAFSFVRMRHLPWTTRFAIFNPEQSSCSVYMIPGYKFRTRTSVLFGIKTGMNSLWNDLYWNEMSSRYHVKKHREIFKDGMNSFQNESCSGIMGITPK